MVFVPQGEFSMGSTAGNIDEQPVHRVFFDAFWIDQVEVTNGQYQQCAAAGACTNPSLAGSFTRDSYYDSKNGEYADFPVIHVNWYEAEGIVKLFGNACGAVDVSGPAGERWWLTASFKPLRR